MNDLGKAADGGAGEEIIMRFRDKLVIVTGGGAGIGLAVAKLFAAEGATVVINDLRGDAAECAAAAIIKTGGQAFAFSGDIADTKQVSASVRKIVERFGRIDVLVNNAGSAFNAPAELYTDFSRSLSVNLGGAMNWSQAVAVTSMIPNTSGVIVNVSSLAGLGAVPGDVGYVASKHGLIGLTKALAVEWAPYHIRVNCIAPGITDSQMVRDAIERQPLIMAERVARVPLGRIAEPEDQAKAVLFLASADAAYITGITLPVDGGQMALHSGFSIR